jgi:hypothetical protein
MNPLNDFERGVYSGLLRARRLAMAGCVKCPHKPAMVGCLERRGNGCVQHDTLDAMDREIFGMLESLPAEITKKAG